MCVGVRCLVRCWLWFVVVGGCLLLFEVRCLLFYSCVVRYAWLFVVVALCCPMLFVVCCFVCVVRCCVLFVVLCFVFVD